MIATNQPKTKDIQMQKKISRDYL